MRPNPISTFIDFMVLRLSWTTPVFWLLIAASILIAVRIWRRDPSQRTPGTVGVAALRILIGMMWWQQSLWKIPPDEGGLNFWLQQVTEHAAIPLQGELVARYVLPNMGFFGPLIYLVEVSIGISLILGVFTRWFALLGLGMSVFLWLGLYSAPGEWPWTYGYLIVIQALFAIDPPGRRLGLEAGEDDRPDRWRGSFAKANPGSGD